MYACTWTTTTELPETLNNNMPSRLFRNLGCRTELATSLHIKHLCIQLNMYSKNRNTTIIVLVLPFVEPINEYFRGCASHPTTAENIMQFKHIQLSSLAFNSGVRHAISPISSVSQSQSIWSLDKCDRYQKMNIIIKSTLTSLRNYPISQWSSVCIIIKWRKIHKNPRTNDERREVKNERNKKYN